VRFYKIKHRYSKRNCLYTISGPLKILAFPDYRIISLKSRLKCIFQYGNMDSSGRNALIPNSCRGV